MFNINHSTAEMGAGFNILEYADPELDITGGEKTNILDLDLEQVEVETKEEKIKKEPKEEEPKTEDLVGSAIVHKDPIQESVTSSVQTPPKTTNILTQAQTVAPIPQTSQVPQQQATMLSQAHPQAIAVQQQMHHHVQNAVAMGKPLPPGTRLLSPDGAIGVVTTTNTVTVSYPATFPGHSQRFPQAHLQGNYRNIHCVFFFLD